MNHLTLLAFSAERRIAAVSLFRGTQLENTLLRHLPLDSAKATGSVRELVTRALEHNRPEFVAISCPASKAGDRIRGFCAAVKEIASGLGVPAIEVDDITLRYAYGYPPLSRKEHVRRAGRTIWPGLNDAKSRRAAVDAAVTGLYVQTERLFSIHSEQP
jgi:hypothetical protein